MKKSLFFIALLLLTEFLSATVYYVDSAVTDTNPASATPDFTTYNHLTFETTGGSDSVYKTVADVNAKAFSAGDFIYFRKGQSWTTTKLTCDNSGTAVSKITYSSYGTGADPIITYSVSGECIRITADYVVIDGLDIRDSTDYWGGGVYIASGADHNTVQNCNIQAVSFGVEIIGQYNLVTNNYIHDLIMDPDEGDGAVGVLLKNTDNEICYNTFENCIAPSNLFTYDGNAFEVYGDASRTYIHHNWCLDNNSFIEVAAGAYVDIVDVLISCNIAYNSGPFGIHLGGAEYITVDNFRVYNNTFVEDRPPHAYAWLGFGASGEAGDFIFKNNIVDLNGFWYFQAEPDWEGWDHDYNDFYMRDDGTLNITPNTHDITSNPSLANWGGTSDIDYKITASSPCRDAGVNVSLTEDYWGNSVPTGGAPDIGAHEYQGDVGEPEINIKYDSTNVGDGGTFTFNQRQIGTNTDQIFTLENNGEEALTLSGSPIITIAGDNADQFSVQAQPTSPIAASGNTTFTIRFSPTSGGAKTATIAIANDDVDENPYNITLTGIGGGGGKIMPGTHLRIKAGAKVRIKS